MTRQQSPWAITLKRAISKHSIDSYCKPVPIVNCRPSVPILTLSFKLPRAALPTCPAGLPNTTKNKSAPRMSLFLASRTQSTLRLACALYGMVRRLDQSNCESRTLGIPCTTILPVPMRWLDWTGSLLVVAFICRRTFRGGLCLVIHSSSNSLMKLQQHRPTSYQPFSGSLVCYLERKANRSEPLLLSASSNHPALLFCLYLFADSGLPAKLSF